MDRRSCLASLYRIRSGRGYGWDALLQIQSRYYNVWSPRTAFPAEYAVCISVPRRSAVHLLCAIKQCDVPVHFSSRADYSSSSRSPAPPFIDCEINNIAMSSHSLPPPPGIYTPLVTFFQPDSSLDLDAIRAHALRIAQGGVAGLVLQGSNGEAVHLDNEERQTIIRTVRSHLNENGYPGLSLIIGCGLPSAIATVKLTKEAKTAGGDFALVLPPSYWPGAMSKPVLVKFFEEVADQSPLPILVYNFPLVANGINIDSDTMIQLSKHQNIVGCKLTCGVCVVMLRHWTLN
jgi:hypothetical protein